MTKAVAYLQQEMRGIRTGRASTALVDYIKVDYYGSATELKSIAAISVPEPTQILIKPFDAADVSKIKTAIEESGLGLNPQVEAKQIRLNVPALSGERRQQLAAPVKKMGEEQKVAIRNTRRDANKHADGIAKDYPEDEISTLKDEIQELLKKYEAEITKTVDAKCTEVLSA